MSLRDVRHVVIDHDKTKYCGHPRQQGGMWNSDGGEVAVMYRRAPCAYETAKDVAHSPFDGYMSRSDLVLRRSYDHGETWRPEDDVIVWSNAIPLEEKREFLRQDPARRQALDMSGPGAMFFMGNTSMHVRDPDTRRLANPTPELTGSFQIRSTDEGRTWESVPLVLEAWGYPPLVALPDGTHARTAGTNRVFLSVSDDGGMSWTIRSEIAPDPEGTRRFTYSGLLALPDGRLQCYVMQFEGRQALCVTESDDGLTWSELRPIVRYGHGPWTARRWGPETYALRTAYGGWEQRYRSPWPLLLRDGRIVVVFARREWPPSIAVVWSEDEGRSWSDEAVIRDDGEGSDLGYPVATELDDGRILTAYYFQKNDGNGFGGTCFIGGSFFALA